MSALRLFRVTVTRTIYVLAEDYQGAAKGADSRAQYDDANAEVDATALDADELLALSDDVRALPPYAPRGTPDRTIAEWLASGELAK